MKEIAMQQVYRPVLDRPAGPKPAGQERPSGSFEQMLRSSLAEVNRRQMASDDAAQALATGQGADIHRAMIAMEKAEISFKLLMEVRNKIVAAYDEIRRMQV